MATSIRLDPLIEQRLDYLAAQTGRTKAYYLREIIKQGLEDAANAGAVCRPCVPSHRD